MSKRNDAFNAVMGELKGRIASHSSERLRRKAQDPVHGGEHEEPDGDEDAEGNEPEGPEEVPLEKLEGGRPDFSVNRGSYRKTDASGQRTHGHGLKAIDLPEDSGPMELEENENAKRPMKSTKSPADGNCHNCGHPNTEGHKYCPGCGTSKG